MELAMFSSLLHSLYIYIEVNFKMRVLTGLVIEVIERFEKGEPMVETLKKVNIILNPVDLTMSYIWLLGDKALYLTNIKYGTTSRFPLKVAEQTTK